MGIGIFVGGARNQNEFMDMIRIVQFQPVNMQLLWRTRCEIVFPSHTLSHHGISKMITFILKEFDFGFCQRMEKCLPMVMVTCIDTPVCATKNVRRVNLSSDINIGTVATVAR